MKQVALRQVVGAITILVVIPRPSIGQTNVRAQVQCVFAAQFTVSSPNLGRELTLGPHECGSGLVRLPNAPDTVGDLLIWRAPYPADHGSDYTIATGPGVLLRLGGFPSPDLYGLAHALKLPARTPVQAWRVGRQLALLDAPYGPAYTRFPADSGTKATDTTVVAWGGQRVPEFPRDSVFDGPDGTYVVRITRLTYIARSYATYWSHQQYVFMLTRAGDLLGYSSYSSPDLVFQAPPPPAWFHQPE